MSLKGIAQETLSILDAGYYTSPTGVERFIAQEQGAAIAETRLYRPEELDKLLEQAPRKGAPPHIRVIRASTQAEAQRMAQGGPLVLLNFASARNPGGGFINGAKAQEEDVARCSGLYPCLMTQPDYYEHNRRSRNLLYSDHIIYSPRVPFFRVKSRELLEEPFLASVITAPAPNAGQVLSRKQHSKATVEACLRRRAGKVLAVAQDQGERRLLLGAWGCGVFRNDPRRVADAFGAWIEGPRFAGAFDEVVFAIYSRKGESPNLLAFKARFPENS